MCALALTTSEILSPPAPEAGWDVPSAFAYCERLTKQHYENFPVASWRMRADKRRYVYAVYAFARAADDFADEQHIEGGRLEHLERWEAELEKCAAGHPDHPTFIALGETLRQCDIPVQLFRDLLHAFRMDVTKSRYATFDEVLDYCRYSANPVGRIVLAIFDYRDELLEHQSDCICTGLQLANHWQDVDVDRKKDRVYLPQEDMARFGYSVEKLMVRKYDADFRQLLKFEVDRAWELFKEGKPLCSRVGWDINIEMRATWLGGTTILRKIEAVDYNVFERRPQVTTGDKVRILMRALLGIGFPRAQPAPKRATGNGARSHG